MNKAEFVDKLAAKTGFTKKDARHALDSMIDLISGSLAGNEEVLLTGFGKFETRTCKASTRVNPQMREKMSVPAKFVPAFKTGGSLRTSRLARKEVVKSYTAALNGRGPYKG